MKDTYGKPKLGLIPFNALKAVAYVREFGINKYGSNDEWAHVADRDFVEAALRHLHKHASGEVIDEESGLSHLSHAACSALLAIAVMEQRPPHILSSSVRSDGGSENKVQSEIAQSEFEVSDMATNDQQPVHSMESNSDKKLNVDGNMETQSFNYAYYNVTAGERILPVKCKYAKMPVNIEGLKNHEVEAQMRWRG